MEFPLTVSEAGDLVRHVAYLAGAEHFGNAVYRRVRGVQDWDVAAEIFQIALGWWREMEYSGGGAGHGARLDYLLFCFAYPTEENLTEAIYCHAKRSGWPKLEEIKKRV